MTRKNDSCSGPDGRLLAIQAQRQAFGAAAGFKEFIQLGRVRLIAPVLQVRGKALAATGRYGDAIPALAEVSSRWPDTEAAPQP